MSGYGLDGPGIEASGFGGLVVSMLAPGTQDRFLEVLFCQTVKHSLPFGLDLLNGIKPASFQLQFHFWKRKNSQGTKSGEYGGWGMKAICISPETAG
jgi:hypothetical protein